MLFTHQQFNTAITTPFVTIKRLKKDTSHLPFSHITSQNLRTEMAKLSFASSFILFLFVTGVLMEGGARARNLCSVELDPNKCDVLACQEGCMNLYRGWGGCAHFGLQIFHCVCTYVCP